MDRNGARSFVQLMIGHHKSSFQLLNIKMTILKKIESKKEYATSSSYSAAEWNGVTVFQFDRVLYTVGNVTIKDRLPSGLPFCVYLRTIKLYGNITR